MDAVVVGFLPGPFAGNVVADFLTGRVNPSGRLPLTYPKHQDLSGIPYLHAVSDMCTKDTGGTLPHWDYVPCEVQWPFGHGLSYSAFTYSNMQLSTNKLHHHWNDDDLSEKKEKKNDDDGKLTVTVRVTNEGGVAGAETVMFFAFDMFRSTTPEFKRLKGYEKVWIEPGESKDVSITISLEDDLRFVGPHDDSHYILQDGLEFKVGIGSWSDCRSDNNSDNNNLCSDPVTIRTEKDYVGACEAACNLWRESGGDCATQAFSSKAPYAACRKACSSIHFDGIGDVQLNNDGWGWNYVKCLESILWSETFDSGTSCWKLTSFCRDVTQTPTMDEFGSGVGSKSNLASGEYLGGSSKNSETGDDPPPMATIVAMLCGFFAAGVMMHAIRGGFASGDVFARQNNTATRGGKYGNVEFSSIELSSFANNNRSNFAIC